MVIYFAVAYNDHPNCLDFLLTGAAMFGLATEFMYWSVVLLTVPPDALFYDSYFLMIQAL